MIGVGLAAPSTCSSKTCVVLFYLKKMNRGGNLSFLVFIRKAKFMVKVQMNFIGRRHQMENRFSKYYKLRFLWMHSMGIFSTWAWNLFSLGRIKMFLGFSGRWREFNYTALNGRRGTSIPIAVIYIMGAINENISFLPSFLIWLCGVWPHHNHSPVYNHLLYEIRACHSACTSLLCPQAE